MSGIRCALAAVYSRKGLSGVEDVARQDGYHRSRINSASIMSCVGEASVGADGRECSGRKVFVESVLSRRRRTCGELQLSRGKS